MILFIVHNRPENCQTLNLEHGPNHCGERFHPFIKLLPFLVVAGQVHWGEWVLNTCKLWSFASVFVHPVFWCIFDHFSHVPSIICSQWDRINRSEASGMMRHYYYCSGRNKCQEVKQSNRLTLVLIPLSCCKVAFWATLKSSQAMLMCC